MRKVFYPLGPMRIIAGTFRSRRLIPPRDETTRPITDRVKESLFNYLREHFDGANVVDLFSGTGSLGLEAISRGAEQVLFVERERETVKRLKENIEMFGVEDLCRVVTGEALGPACLTQAPQPIHLAFIDPPYRLMQGPMAATVIEQMNRLAPMMDPEGFIILRTHWPMSDDQLTQLNTDQLAGPETRPYKSMAINFYQVQNEDS